MATISLNTNSVTPLLTIKSSDKHEKSASNTWGAIGFGIGGGLLGATILGGLFGRMGWRAGGSGDDLFISNMLGAIIYGAAGVGVGGTTGAIAGTLIGNRL